MPPQLSDTNMARAISNAIQMRYRIWSWLIQLIRVRITKQMWTTTTTQKSTLNIGNCKRKRKRKKKKKKRNEKTYNGIVWRCTQKNAKRSSRNKVSSENSFKIIVSDISHDRQFQWIFVLFLFVLFCVSKNFDQYQNHLRSTKHRLHLQVGFDEWNELCFCFCFKIFLKKKVSNPCWYKKD